MTKLTQEDVDKYKGSETTVYLMKIDVSEDAVKDLSADDEDDADLSDELEFREGVYYALLHKPKRKDISNAMSRSRKDPLAMGETLIKNCIILGDDEITNIAFQDTVGLQASMQASKLFAIGEGSLKKL